MAARAEVHIKGSETVSTAAEKASGSIHQLRGHVKDTIQPMKDLAASARDLLAFGGLAAGATILYRGLSDCEKAFEKLHPEVAKMPGSIASWTAAQEGLKASIGGLISNFMSPLRQALIDQAVEWTKNIDAVRIYREELAKLEKSKIFGQIGPAMGKVQAQVSGFEQAGFAPNKAIIDLQASIDKTNALYEKAMAILATPLTPEQLAAAVAAAAAKAAAEAARLSAVAREMGAVDFARIMRAEIESMAKAEKVIADAREMAAVDFARIMRGEGPAVPAFTAEMARGTWPAMPFNAEDNAFAARFQIAADQMADQMGEVADAFDYVYDSVQAFGETISSFLVDSVVDLARSFWNLILSSEPVTDLMERFSGALEGIVNQLGTLLSNAITPILDALVWMVELIGGSLGPVFEQLNIIITAIMPSLYTLGQIIVQLMPAMNALITIVVTMLTPYLNILATTLKLYLVGMELLWPVLRFFIMALDIASRPIEWLGDVVAFIAAYFVYLGKCLADFVYNLTHLVNPRNTAGTAPTFGSDAFTRPITDIGAWVTPTAAPTTENPYSPVGGNGGGASSSTTVQHVPDIYVYMTFEGPVVGPGGGREVGEFVVGAISEYLGTGAHVNWLEN